MLTATNRDDRLAHSVIDWWKLAGVEWDYTETPNDWLAQDAPPAAAGPAPRVQPEPTRYDAAAAPVPVAAAAPVPQIELPEDLAEFQRLWREGGLAEDSGSGPHIGPSGEADPSVMVLTGAPEPDDQAAILTGRSGTLLENVLRGCAIDPATVYRASFYPRVVLDGREAARHVAEWRRIAMHHIGLVRPGALVVAGEETVRALMGHDLSQKPPVLHFLNHGDRTIKMVVTRKLPLMLHRSAEEKAMAWQSWQLLLVE